MRSMQINPQKYLNTDIQIHLKNQKHLFLMVLCLNWLNKESCSSKTTATFVLLYSVKDSIPYFGPFHNLRFPHIFDVNFVKLADLKSKASEPEGLSQA